MMQLPSVLPPGTTLTLQPSQQQHAPAQVQQDVQLLDLKPQQIVQASVLRGGMNQAELELGRQKFKAVTKVPLSTGQVIQAQVVQTSPYIELRLIDQSALNRLFQTLHLFQDHFNLTGILHRSDLGQMLRGQAQGANMEQAVLQAGALLGQSSSLDGDGLAGLLRLLGLDLERLLLQGQSGRAGTTLKAALQAVLQSSQEQSSGLKGQVENLLEQMELFQTCRARLAQMGKEWLPLPLPFVHQGYLIAERQAGENQGTGHDQDQPPLWTLGIFLTMHSLGTLNIHLVKSEHGLAAKVLCQSQETAKVFEAAREEFVQTIQALPVHSLQIGLGAEDPVQHLLHSIVPQGRRTFEAWG